MRILVCGGRDFDNWSLLDMTLIRICWDVEEIIIIEGGARGADFLARVWAKHCGFEYEEYPADWNKYGKSAGYIRNKQMLTEGDPDLVVAFPGGKGTADMIKQAREAGVEVREIVCSV